MEEGKNIHQAGERRVWACGQGLLGDFRVCGSHVKLEAIGGLCHYLHNEGILSYHLLLLKHLCFLEAVL